MLDYSSRSHVAIVHACVTSWQYSFCNTIARPTTENVTIFLLYLVESSTLCILYCLLY